MPAPAVYTYDSAIKIAAQQVLLDALDAGASNAKLFLRDDNDVLLSTLVCTDPAGTIDGNGTLTITFTGPDTNAAATGTCTYGEFVDSNNAVCLTVPVIAGDAPVYGYLVMNTNLILAGGTVSVISAQVG